MKYFLILLTTTLFLVSCSDGVNCSNFKTGTFTYQQDFGARVIRNNNIQTETDPKTNAEIKSTINWLSDCKCTLTIVEVNGSTESEAIGTNITVEILPISENSYEYHGFIDDYEINGKMNKVN